MEAKKGRTTNYFWYVIMTEMKFNNSLFDEVCSQVRQICLVIFVTHIVSRNGFVYVFDNNQYIDSTFGSRLRGVC